MLGVPVDLVVGLQQPVAELLAIPEVVEPRQRGQVLGMVMRESMLLVGIGAAAGLAAAIAASRFPTRRPRSTR